MRTHLRLGRLLGVPIGINGGVLLVSVLLAISLAQVSLPSIAPRHPTSAYWFAAVLGVVGFLVSLVGHELGHSYIAQRNGVRVAEITLWLFGGVAKLEGDADEPGAEFRIAAAGPAMSMVIAVLAGLSAWEIDQLDGSRVLLGLLVWLSAINVILAVSNLLPAFPLDGGRMLRAFLWRRSGRKRRATRTAAMIGQVLAVVILIAAVVLFFPMGDRWSGAWILALGLLGASVALPFTERLPLVVQRTICFLPVKVNPAVRFDAWASTDWRLRMWNVIVEQIPRYFWVGKGYGGNAAELNLLKESMKRSINDFFLWPCPCGFRIIAQRTGVSVNATRPDRMIVEDIVTTGLSIRETIDCLRGLGAEVLAAACIIDRSAGKTDVGVPLIALAEYEVPAYPVDRLPPELAAIPAVKPGSRSL